MGRTQVRLRSGVATVENGIWTHRVPAVAKVLNAVYSPSEANASIPDRDLWAAQKVSKALKAPIIKTTPIKGGPPGTVY